MVFMYCSLKSKILIRSYRFSEKNHSNSILIRSKGVYVHIKDRKIITMHPAIQNKSFILFLLRTSLFRIARC